MTLGLAVVAAVAAGGSLHAQPQPPVSETPAKEGEPGAADKLALEEQRIAERYKHLEDVLLRMAELSATTDPRRAALLKKAIAQSKEQLVTVRLDRLVELLGKDQLSRALENQAEVEQDLRALLELLLSENRAKHIENEKARLREFLKRLSGVIKQEKDLQARTAGGDDPKRLAGEQSGVADKTRELAKDIQKSDQQKEGGAQKADAGGKTDRKEEGDSGGKQEGKEGGKQSEKGGTKEAEKEGGAQQAEGQKDSGGKEGDKEEGKDHGKEEGQEGGKEDSKEEGKDGGQEDGKKDQDTTEQNAERPKDPTYKRIEAAEQRMREAEAKLKEAQRQGAVEKQEEAIRELQMAKAKLEEILRQLREEEVERMLAMLESRFRKMLEMQEEVYEGTVRLDKVPSAERTHNHEIEASRLSGKQSQIVIEIDKALLLLRDDGSAVAFLEASQQMREDMQQVVERLAQTKVGQLTQNLEEDVIAALKEMIEALKKAQKDKEKGKKKAGQQSPGQPQDPPLVDVLAELKMIRALQMRVNTRTARYSKMVEGEQADSAELVDALKGLAEREQRIHRVTRDLQMGKNQ